MKRVTKILIIITNNIVFILRVFNRLKVKRAGIAPASSGHSLIMKDHSDLNLFSKSLDYGGASSPEID